MGRLIFLLCTALIALSCNKDGVIGASTEEFYRPKNSYSLARASEVFEYTPAPGQFINETATGGFTGNEKSPEAAAEYAMQRLKKELFVSLGAFGGYIIVGFDHSIDNNPGYDFAIKGNSFDGSSEPGIVWVMQDQNGDGLPNDTWYQLRGSESGLATTIENYEVTYYKPEAPGMAVLWKDNRGASGEVDYLAAYHKQDYYYPAWIEAPSYTLKGTALEPRNYDKSGNGTYWVQPHYDWGYVDNYSPTDLDKATNSPTKGCNLFDISNAMESNGSAHQLKYIDFIKVQTAVNTKSGWLGENSTEVFGFYDYSMISAGNL